MKFYFSADDDFTGRFRYSIFIGPQT